MTDTQHNKAPPTVPEGRRVYAIGDIHGRRDLLDELLARITDDAKARGGAENILVFLGDYVDRGPDARGVLDRLTGPMPDGFDAVFIKGNHEDMMLRFLAGRDPSGTFLANGGTATLASYDATADDPAFTLPDEHLYFLNELKLSHVVGDYLFVHAGIRPGVGIDDQSEVDLMWIRDEFFLSDETFEKCVVHGHSVTFEPEVRANRIGIDTGAWRSGILTCLVLEAAERRFLSSGDNAKFATDFIAQ
ncbi:MAG: metallophosphoesterase family protein [Alphaproteobacteria bacterium]